MTRPDQRALPGLSGRLFGVFEECQLKMMKVFVVEAQLRHQRGLGRVWRVSAVAQRRPRVPRLSGLHNKRE